MLFFDDNQTYKLINDCNVIGYIDDIKLYYPEYQNIVIAIDNSKLRKKLSDKGTFVFSNAVIETDVKIDKGFTAKVKAGSEIKDETAVSSDNEYCFEMGV